MQKSTSLRSSKHSALLILSGLVVWWILNVLGGLRGDVRSIAATGAGRYIQLTYFSIPFGKRSMWLHAFDREQRTLGWRLFSKVYSSFAHGRSARGELAILEHQPQSTVIHLLDPVSLETRITAGIAKVSDCSFSHDGRWLIAQDRDQSQIRMFDSDTLQEVALTTVSADGHSEPGPYFWLCDQQLLIYGDGQMRLTELGYGNGSEVVQCLQVNETALLLQVHRWFDQDGNLANAPDSTAKDSNSLTTDDASSDLDTPEDYHLSMGHERRENHVVYWPLATRSHEMPAELAKRRPTLMADGQRLLTIDDEPIDTWFNARPRMARLYDLDGRQLAEYLWPPSLSGSQETAFSEWLLERNRSATSHSLQVVDANTLSVQAVLYPSRDFRTVHWLLRALGLAWLGVWLWPTLRQGQSLISVGGAMLMLQALLNVHNTVLLQYKTLTLPMLVVPEHIPMAFAIWWMFASTMPLHRLLPTLTIVCVLFWEANGIQTSTVLIALIITAGCAAIKLVSSRSPRVTQAPANKTFTIGDIFLWTTGFAVCTLSTVRLPDFDQLRAFDVIEGVVFCALWLGGAALTVYGRGRYRIVGMVMLFSLAVLIGLKVKFGDPFELILLTPNYLEVFISLAMLATARGALSLLTWISGQRLRPAA